MPWQAVAGGEIFYQVEGSGPPLLLLHGLGSSHRDWEEQVPFFSRHFRVIALDLRGHGRSRDCPGPYTIPCFAADAAVLLKALEAGPAGVVGISLGGMAALQLALDYPGRVDRLVIVNAPVRLPRSSWRVGWAMGLRLFVARFLGMRVNGVILSRQVFPRPEQAALRKKFAQRWAENEPRAYTAALKNLYGWSIEDRLSELRCSVLVVAGADDFIPLAEKERYARLIPAAELQIIGSSGHASPVDQAQEFNRLTAGFLEKGW
jgi:3-oxoadipate enol-lactonase